ncbi:lectin-like protein, partial [Salmonella sp. s54395]|uniref:lectin-like protein n=1 Tax=Salmonella sp. s54395 TaxID=3159664 RepID=UPI00397F930C
AHILLSTTKDIDSETPLYEIVIGADGNKRSFIRRCQVCESENEQKRPYLHKRRFKDMFVNFHEGNIQVGDMQTRKLMLEFNDPLPMRVRYIGFKSVSRVGRWRFYDTEFKWNTEESWNYDNFRFGEPSNHHDEETCLETNFLRPGLWNDHFCSEEKAFMCEIDAY